MRLMKFLMKVPTKRSRRTEYVNRPALAPSAFTTSGQMRSCSHKALGTQNTAHAARHDTRHTTHDTRHAYLEEQLELVDVNEEGLVGGEKGLDELEPEGLRDGLHGQPDRVVSAGERAQILHNMPR
jgi:hypothetical protein